MDRQLLPFINRPTTHEICSHDLGRQYKTVHFCHSLIVQQPTNCNNGEDYTDNVPLVSTCHSQCASVSTCHSQCASVAIALHVVGMKRGSGTFRHVIAKSHGHFDMSLQIPWVVLALLAVDTKRRYTSKCTAKLKCRHSLGKKTWQT